MSDTLIGPGKTVTLHFALKMEDGAVIDSTFDKDPARFQVGDGNLLEGFERALFGLKTGDQSTLRIAPEQAFGQSNPNNVQQIERMRFSTDLELEEGLVISFADAAQGELPGVVKAFDEQRVTVDFNHPLAGQSLLFDVDILDVV